MDEIKKNTHLLKEVFKQLRDLIHLKDDEIPSKAWEEEYEFLERLKEHYLEKISQLRWLEVEETLRPIREEEREERIRNENSGNRNTYQQQHLKDLQKKNTIERNQQKREDERRNLKISKKNVLKEIQDKENEL